MSRGVVTPDLGDRFFGESGATNGHLPPPPFEGSVMKEEER
jgi:hypothetical protein